MNFPTIVQILKDCPPFAGRKSLRELLTHVGQPQLQPISTSLARDVVPACRAGELPLIWTRNRERCYEHVNADLAKAEDKEKLKEWALYPAFAACPVFSGPVKLSGLAQICGIGPFDSKEAVPIGKRLYELSQAQMLPFTVVQRSGTDRRGSLAAVYAHNSWAHNYSSLSTFKDAFIEACPKRPFEDRKYMLDVLYHTLPDWPNMKCFASGSHSTQGALTSAAGLIARKAVPLRKAFKAGDHRWTYVHTGEYTDAR